VAAIYARKSTEQVGVTDEQRSVTRQIEHARASALAHGWVVGEEYLFVDDGISGAEFRKRPGLTRLLNALRPRPPFQVLIMSEESRLGLERDFQSPRPSRQVAKNDWFKSRARNTERYPVPKAHWVDL